MTTATLFYGLTVTTSSRFLAAYYFPRLKPVFRGLDHIILKRRNGTLSTETNSGIEKLPAEIWEMVKNELIKLELRKVLRIAQRRKEKYERRVLKRQTKVDRLEAEGEDVTDLQLMHEELKAAEQVTTVLKVKERALLEEVIRCLAEKGVFVPRKEIYHSDMSLRKKCIDRLKDGVKELYQKKYPL